MAVLRGSEKADRFGIYDGPTDESDTIDGLGGDDIIYGLGGNDHITGGAGADFIFGGAGFDTAYYVDSDAGVFIDLTASSGRYGSAEGDLLISIEALVGSRFDDNLIGNAEDNDLRGGDGADYLYGLDGSDWLQGGLGADTIIGGDDWRFDFADYSDSFERVIVQLQYHSGALGTAEGDRLFGIEGLIGFHVADYLGGDVSDNYIFAGDDNDLVFGLAGMDHLYGEGGNDFLEGGAGGDFLHGGAGSDTASYQSSSGRVLASLIAPGHNTGDAKGDVYLSIERLVGSAFNDVLEGDNDDNALYGGNGPDVLFGFDGADFLTGGIDRDYLSGGDGADVLHGDDGEDTLVGGLNVSVDPATGALIYNTEHLDGGAGADTFIWEAVAESAGMGTDEVENFNFAEGDRLDLHVIDADATTPFNDAFTFVGDIGPGAPGRGEISYTVAPGWGVYLRVNNDADPESDMVIQVQTPDTPTASWFVL